MLPNFFALMWFVSIWLLHLQCDQTLKYKIAEIVSKSCPKSIHSSLYMKIVSFKNQELSKIAQFGQTVPFQPQTS